MYVSKYVCMFTEMHLYNIYIYKRNMNECICEFMYVCMYVGRYFVCILYYMYTILYVCMYVCMCACMYLPELCKIFDVGEQLDYLIAAQNQFLEIDEFPE